MNKVTGFRNMLNVFIEYARCGEISLHKGQAYVAFCTSGGVPSAWVMVVGVVVAEGCEVAATGSVPPWGLSQRDLATPTGYKCWCFAGLLEAMGYLLLPPQTCIMFPSYRFWLGFAVSPTMQFRRSIWYSGGASKSFLYLALVVACSSYLASSTDISVRTCSRDVSTIPALHFAGWSHAPIGARPPHFLGGVLRSPTMI